MKIIFTILLLLPSQSNNKNNNTLKNKKLLAKHQGHHTMYIFLKYFENLFLYKYLSKKTCNAIYKLTVTRQQHSSKSSFLP